MRIGKIASDAECRMNEQYQNFQFWKNSRNLSIFQFQLMDNSKNFQFGRFQKLSFL